MSLSRLEFFNRVFAESSALIEQLPLTVEPARMDYITGTLAAAVEAEGLKTSFSALRPPRERTSPSGNVAAGLNTVGMLLDRLSILGIKHWNLRRRRGDEEKASELIDTQVNELIEALSIASPGHSSLNNKMSSRSVKTESSDFGEAYYGLLATNLLIWESQEILYNHDIQTLPCEELRSYVDFFSKKNLTRNAFIEATDAMFWSEARDRGGIEAPGPV